MNSILICNFIDISVFFECILGVGDGFICRKSPVKLRYFLFFPYANWVSDPHKNLSLFRISY